MLIDGFIAEVIHFLLERGFFLLGGCCIRFFLRRGSLCCGVPMALLCRHDGMDILLRRGLAVCRQDKDPCSEQEDDGFHSISFPFINTTRG